jgi:hypothetical protein
MSYFVYNTNYFPIQINPQICPTVSLESKQMFIKYSLSFILHFFGRTENKLMK